MPDFSLESSLAVQGPVCGVDEAGRGPLAGPVVAAAVILPSALKIDGIDDSKALSAARREEVFVRLRAEAVIGIGAASVAEIARLNILHASLLAMTRAVAALPVRPGTALVDGNRVPDLPCRALAIVGGDARSLSIAAASIIAKVTRDQIMSALGKRWPGYGLEQHMGYPTKAHREALARLGRTPHHRLGFAGVPQDIAQRALKTRR